MVRRKAEAMLSLSRTSLSTLQDTIEDSVIGDGDGDAKRLGISALEWIVKQHRVCVEEAQALQRRKDEQSECCVPSVIYCLVVFQEVSVHFPVTRVNQSQPPSARQSGSRSSLSRPICQSASLVRQSDSPFFRLVLLSLSSGTVCSCHCLVISSG